MIRPGLKSILIAFCLVSNIQAVPFVFNYQGVFLDSLGKGQPLKDSLRFALFSSPSGTTSLWSESHYIVSSNGVFSVNLGSRSRIYPSLILSNDSIYLEITKGNIKGNRIKINSVVYAIKSSLSDTANFAKIADSARYAPSAAFSDSSKASFRSQTALIADSALKNGQKTWELKGTTAYYNKGNVSIGGDSASQRLDVVGSAIIENPVGDANLYLAAGSNASLIFRQINGPGSGDRAKFVYSNNALQLNLWDSTGALEIPGVLVLRQTGVVLDAKGMVKATGFMVANIPLNVPDYVFDSTYSLKTLQDLETYIQSNHHLPGLPSAEEIQSQGLDLTRMNLKLLEKVEELTLYIIEQDKALKALQQNSRDQKK